MRPLMHPHIDEITVEGLLHALADPVRVRIFMEIAAAECPQSCTTFSSVSGRDLPKSTLSQHFKVLREAGLIRSERSGVALHNSSRCKELKPRFGVLIEAILCAYRRQLNDDRRS